MKFCCNDFESIYKLPNQLGFNIRMVKFKSSHLTSRNLVYFTKNSVLNKTKNKRDDIRFFMTMGYEKFSLKLVMSHIAFCPYCGTNLYDFYVDDECANEIEGETFEL